MEKKSKFHNRVGFFSVTFSELHTNVSNFISPEHLVLHLSWKKNIVLLSTRNRHFNCSHWILQSILKCRFCVGPRTLQQKRPAWGITLVVKFFPPKKREDTCVSLRCETLATCLLFYVCFNFRYYVSTNGDPSERHVMRYVKLRTLSPHAVPAPLTPTTLSDNRWRHIYFAKLFLTAITGFLWSSVLSTSCAWLFIVAWTAKHHVIWPPVITPSALWSAAATARAAGLRSATSGSVAVPRTTLSLWPLRACGTSCRRHFVELIQLTFSNANWKHFSLPRLFNLLIFQIFQTDRHRCCVSRTYVAVILTFWYDMMIW